MCRSLQSIFCRTNSISHNSTHCFQNFRSYSLTVVVCSRKLWNQRLLQNSSISTSFGALFYLFPFRGLKNAVGQLSTGKQLIAMTALKNILRCYPPAPNIWSSGSMVGNANGPWATRSPIKLLNSNIDLLHHLRQCMFHYIAQEKNTFQS